MDLTRQLRNSEKHVDESKNLATEVETLKETNKELEEQIVKYKNIKAFYGN